MKETMKKIFLMVASVALMAMVACNKEEVNGEVSAAGTVEFVASLDDTKTALVDGKTEWVAGDAISVNGVKFTTAESGAAVLFTNAEDVPADFKAPYKAVYPYGANGVPASQTSVAGNFDPMAVVETATSETKTLSFTNVVSLLKFQVPANCSVVTLTSDNELAGAEGAYENSVSISGSFVKETDYYVAVLPGTKANFVVKIDEKISKQAASVEIARSSIVNMGTLPATIGETWGICGTFTNGWDITKNSHMTPVGDGWCELTGVELYKDDEFKFVQNDGWTVSLGASGSALTADDNKEYTLTSDNGQNIKVSKNGVFTIRLNPAAKKFIATCTEEYSDLKVKVYVDNQKGWNPLYFHCWVENGDKDVALTEWPGNEMTKDVNGMYYYEIDAAYIGSTIGYIVNNGSDQTDDLFQKLTKDGFTYILPNEICKLIVKVNKSIDWYDKYLYSWTDAEGEYTGGWPGTKLTYDKEEGNYYVYHYDYPGTMDGKKIKYIINGNGSGQTYNLEVTLYKTEETTVTIEKSNVK